MSAATRERRSDTSADRPFPRLLSPENDRPRISCRRRVAGVDARDGTARRRSVQNARIIRSMRAALSAAVVVALFCSERAIVAQGTAGPRWPPGTSVRVWVDGDEAPAGASALVDRALRTWTAAAAGSLVLMRTPDAKAAGIQIHFGSRPGLYGETRPRI